VDTNELIRQVGLRFCAAHDASLGYIASVLNKTDCIQYTTTSRHLFSTVVILAVAALA